MASLDRALDRLDELLRSEDEHVALRAAVQIFDRVLGRPRQPLEHSGRVEVDMVGVRAKLARLIEREAESLAEKNGA